MNKHERDQYYKRIILRAINREYMEECGYATLTEACKAEKGVQGVVTQSDIAEWLQGLPSACEIPYWNDEICRMAYETGSLKPEDSENRHIAILENYFQYMAAKVMQIDSGYHVPTLEGEE